MIQLISEWIKANYSQFSKFIPQSKNGINPNSSANQISKVKWVSTATIIAKINIMTMIHWLAINRLTSVYIYYEQCHHWQYSKLIVYFNACVLPQFSDTNLPPQKHRFQGFVHKYKKSPGPLQWAKLGPDRRCQNSHQSPFVNKVTWFPAS